MRTLAIAALTVLATAAPSAAQDEAPSQPEDIWQAIQSGRTWLDLRYRYEGADIEGFANDADASTLRTALGYETARYEGFRGFLEFESISLIGDNNFNSTTNGVGDHPVVADPIGSEVNQVYVAYDGFEGVDIKVGRQEIALGNHRFIGSVPWRQNHQSFDAVRISAKDIGAGISLDYSSAWNVNRIFGDDNANGNELLNGHFLNLNRDLGALGKGTAYGYLVDFDRNQALSSNTFGARIQGSHEVAEGKIGWVVEGAQQTDAFSNPVDLDADYRFFELSGTFYDTTLKIASETLGGSGAAGDKFSTPFATLHKFNGFADVFLNTPDAGLEDQYVALSRGFKVDGLPGPIKLMARYHMFSPDAGGADYGTELDLNALIPLTERVKLGIRYADFNADDDSTFADVTRVMAWLHYRVF